MLTLRHNPKKRVYTQILGMDSHEDTAAGISRQAQLVDVVNSLLYISNVDVYVTGSNSRVRAIDVVTEFRGGG